MKVGVEDSRPLIVIFGTGALARALAHSLSDVRRGEASVIIAGRSAADADGIARSASVRSWIQGGRWSFSAERVLLEDSADLGSFLNRTRPQVLVCCASLHAPADLWDRRSRWAALVEQAGFGVTTALHAPLVLNVARAAKQNASESLLINACYPDVMNWLLAALALPVFCGIGNIGTIAACLQHALRGSDQQHLKAIGHHYHLRRAPGREEAEVQAWFRERRVRHVDALLSSQRSIGRLDMNAIAGSASALVVASLACDIDLETHVPGPLGLPGGYPVRLSGRSLSLRLPRGVDEETATNINLDASLRDGVGLHPDGSLTFSERARESLARYSPALSEGFQAESVGGVAREFVKLRERLR
jgi:hypothetical protein